MVSRRHRSTQALLFGALISAVDPVATLSIMGSPELNCDPLLYSLVFGESVLNDAVAIVLFRTFYNYYEEGAELDQSKIPVALFEFLFVTIGSILMGVATGLICSYLFRHTRIRDYPKYEISLLFLFAYGAYALAESIELSGIMALFFCGIVLAHYNSYNLSKTSQTTAEEIFAALSTVAESFVFMYMGMGFFTGRFKT
jgi:sodium/hydrogen exchanger 8